MSTEDRARAVPVGFEDRLAIATPEGVEIELTLAGIGSRFIASVIDFAIRLLPLIALAIVLDPSGVLGAAVFTLIDFGMQFFYNVLFEVLGGGRTPGKRATGLRVVRTGGRPVTFVRSMLRNILRIVDVLPAFYLVGMVSIFVTDHNQRLGDLAAGTLVVRDRHGDRRHGEAPLSELATFDPGTALSWDISAVSAEDVATVRTFLARREHLAPGARVALADELATRLRPLVGGADERADERFLEMLVAAKLRRSA